MIPENPQTEAEVVAALARQEPIRTPDFSHSTPAGVPLLILHEKTADGEVSKVQLNADSDWMPTPLRIETHRKFTDLESFLGYVEKFKASGTAIYANDDFERILTAVIDDNEPGNPTWGKHVATYQVQPSEEWKAWTSACREPITQVGFGDLIEDMMHTIAAPAASVLKQAILNFESKKDAHFKQVVNLDNGDMMLSYSEEEKNGDLKVPKDLTLSLPIFKNDLKTATVEVGIRYRTNQGKLSFLLRIKRKDLVIQSILADIREVTEKRLLLPVWQVA